MGEGPRYDGYIFDLDGTVYRGDHLVPGARERVEWLRAHGRRVVFLSNKPLQPRASYAQKLTRLGIAVAEEDVINSTQALMRYLRTRHPGARLYVIGEEAMRAELRAAGFALVEDVGEPASAWPAEGAPQVDVVVAAFDTTLDYRKLNSAYQALARGAHFLATNADRTCPVEGGEIPDCAGVIAFLEATSGRRVEEVVGKPARYMVEAAAERLGVALERCLMVGDRLATDMEMGRQARIDTALVLTGVTTRADLEAASVRPTYVLESIAQVP